MKFYQYLLQKQWFRDLYRKKTFYLSSGIWYDLNSFDKKHKIEDLDGLRGGCCFCGDCKNELVHSDSLIRETLHEEKKLMIWHFKCSFCEKDNYFTPSVSMAVVRCNEKGMLED